MPVRTKPFCGESLDAALGEILVLKATAAKNDLRFASRPCDRDDHVGQRVVEFRGNHAPGFPTLKINHEPLDRRLPIDHSRRATANLEWVGGSDARLDRE